jgi:adenylosuccinate lyase
MTSSDVLDTCLQRAAGQGCRPSAGRPGCAAGRLKRRAIEHKDTVCIGRSHGIHAEPVTFGLKWPGLCRVRPLPHPPRQCPQGNRHLRHLGRRRHLRQYRSARRRTCRQGHGAEAEPVSTQVIPRDRHAMFFARWRHRLLHRAVATEIRHLQRTEVLEAEEYFSQGPEGLVGHAAQAQPGADRKPHRPCPAGAHGYATAGHGKRGALARARHLALLGRTHDRPGRDRDARFRACPSDRRHRQAGGLPGNMVGNMDKLGGLVHSQRVLLALTQAASAARTPIGWSSATP